MAGERAFVKRKGKVEDAQTPPHVSNALLILTPLERRYVGIG